MGSIVHKISHTLQNINRQSADNNSNNNTIDSDMKNDKNANLTEIANSMQLVADRIYMGGAVSAQQLSTLKGNGITHILAIGWNLEKWFINDFEYLLMNEIEDRPGFIILPRFEECFRFMDNALSKESSILFVHCHKGLSRSATIIIAYQMFKYHKKFDEALEEIRTNRSFIMPNIGFQSQLKLFEEKKYSLNMKDYSHLDLDILGKISLFLPKMQKSIQHFYVLFVNEDYNAINDQELFGLTMYVHQVHMLHERKKLKENDSKILYECIHVLRRIQTEFVDDQISLARFDKMFKLKTKLSE